jgi:hypothetical protein
MTDANGDFTSYKVAVTSVQLTRADGTLVETLPATQTVDFAQLVNVSELLSALSVPAGNYVSGSLTVDYTSAAVSVEVNGTPTVATVLNSAKANPGVVKLDLQLDPSKPLVVTPGRIARLALDFNLAASNDVDTTQAPPVVTPHPIIVASIVPADTRETRVRGTLASSDAGTSSYVVNVRPFEERSQNIGQVTVHTTSTTTFEINGAAAVTGTAGFKALAALPAGTITAAFGTLSTTDQSFTATRVLAGTSLESTTLDTLVGNVISRSGKTLTVRGATFGPHDGDDRFVTGSATVTLADATAVTQSGSANTALTSAAISVGQRITAFGKSSTDASGNVTLDATSGRVRLEPTQLTGQFVSGGAGVASIALQSIDGRAVSAFNFAGTGASAAQDADPKNYEIGVQTLPLAGIAAGTPMRFIGFVTPFGAAPPDFTASTLVNFADTASDLQVSWAHGGTAAPFVTLASSGIVVDLANSALGTLHFVRTGPTVLDLKSIPANPKIVADPASTGPFAVGSDPSHVKTLSAFADFVTELKARLGAGAKMDALWARGSFDAASDTFTAKQVAVLLQ